MKSSFIIAAVLSTLLILSGCGGKATPDNTSATSQRVFSSEELKEYDGKDGRPAYIAVKGIVYDVANSPHFTNGVHNECGSTVAGADLTDKFTHFSGTLKRLPVVGSLK